MSLQDAGLTITSGMSRTLENGEMVFSSPASGTTTLGADTLSFTDVTRVTVWRP